MQPRVWLPKVPGWVIRLFPQIIRLLFVILSLAYYAQIIPGIISSGLTSTPKSWKLFFSVLPRQHLPATLMYPIGTYIPTCTYTCTFPISSVRNPSNWMWQAIQCVTSGEAAEVMEVNTSTQYWLSLSYFKILKIWLTKPGALYVHTCYHR